MLIPKQHPAPTQAEIDEATISNVQRYAHDASQKKKMTDFISFLNSFNTAKERSLFNDAEIKEVDVMINDVHKIIINDIKQLLEQDLPSSVQRDLYDYARTRQVQKVIINEDGEEEDLEVDVSSAFFDGLASKHVQGACFIYNLSTQKSNTISDIAADRIYQIFDAE